MGRALAFLLLALLPGCGERTDDTHVVVRDSAGVRIVDWVAAADVPPIVLREVPFSADLPDFGDIQDVAEAPDRGVVVLDPLGPHVVVLDSTGAERLRFGRDGGGPGEFRTSGLTGLVSLGDVVAVPDIMGQRVTLFALTDGRVLETIPVPVAEGMALDWRRLGDGGLVFRRVSTPQRLEVLSVESGAMEVMTDLSTLSLPSTPGPLTPLPIWCVVSEQLTVVGQTDRYVLRAFDGGALTAELRAETSERPIGDEEWSHLEALLAQSLARRFGDGIPPERVRQLLEQTPPPDEAPQLAGVTCSSNGEVWVQRALRVEEMGEGVLRVGSTEGWGASAWDVYSFDEEAVHRVELPEGSGITRVTEHYILGYVTDSLGQKSPARWRRQ